MAIYAVGDVQGCYGSLRRLLDRCRFDPASDRVWFVGDLVNRGPHSLETMRFVRSLGAAATTVLGNHDLYMLMVAEGFGKRQKDDTLAAVMAAPDRDELFDWLRRQPLMHVEGDYAVVHAGLLPQWTVAQARGLAAEVEAWLQGPRWRELLANLWGSQPDSWRDDLTGWDRLRVVVNAMTRLRFCTAEGVMDFQTKGELASAPAGFLPWFEVPGRRSAGEILLIGHWSALGLRLEPDLLALDTGCLWGRHLTAVRLPERSVIQVDCAACDESAPTDPVATSLGAPATP